MCVCLYRARKTDASNSYFNTDPSSQCLIMVDIVDLSHCVEKVKTGFSGTQIGHRVAELDKISAFTMTLRMRLNTVKSHGPHFLFP